MLIDVSINKKSLKIYVVKLSAPMKISTSIFQLLMVDNFQDDSEEDSDPYYR
jgi:hypothetical protein